MCRCAASTPISTARCSAGRVAAARRGGQLLDARGPRARGVPPRRRRGRDQVRPPQGAGVRGRAPDRPARVHLRDGLRARGRRRGGVPDRVLRARGERDASTTRSSARARRACCSRRSRAGSSTTRPGTPTATSRTCSAATSPLAEVRDAVRRARTSTCAWSTTASPRRRSPELHVDEVHVYHLIPAAAGKGARGRDPHAPPRARARRRRSRSATRAATSRSPTSSGRFFLVANGARARPADPRLVRERGRT